MRCPLGEHQLTHFTALNLGLEHCPTCRVFWFPDPVLDALLERLPPDLDLGHVHPADAPNPGLPQTCPACEIETLVAGSCRGVPVAHCPSCRGVLIEASDLQAFRPVRPRLRRHSYKITIIEPDAAPSLADVAMEGFALVLEFMAWP